MVAAHAPGLLRDDDRFYESLTRVQRVLASRERETVWAGLLAAAREVHGFIHMRRAVAAGLNTDDIARAVAIAAVTAMRSATLPALVVRSARSRSATGASGRCCARCSAMKVQAGPRTAQAVRRMAVAISSAVPPPWRTLAM
jgi:alkylhydroperoxidase/carboxymuconolactone decarboxylase family protein YurZ